jgi:hypothetical protein
VGGHDLSGGQAVGRKVSDGIVGKGNLSQPFISDSGRLAYSGEKPLAVFSRNESAGRASGVVVFGAG